MLPDSSKPVSNKTRTVQAERTLQADMTHRLYCLNPTLSKNDK